MNTDTGQIYEFDSKAFQEAQQRNEPLQMVSRYTAGQSKARRQKIGNAMAQLKRTKPHLSDAEREALALKIVSK